MTKPADPVDLSSRPAIQKRWPAILIITVLVLVAAVASLIATGLRDPRPLGEPIATVVPGLRTTNAISDVEWLPGLMTDGELPSTVSLQMKAAYVGGEPDSGYGLVYGNSSHALVVVVSPLRYAAVWERGRPGEPDLVHLPWQPWPHVRTGQTVNEIWLDITNSSKQAVVTARVNREILWRGTVAAPEAAMTGLWVGSWGEPVTVDFESVTVLAP